MTASTLELVLLAAVAALAAVALGAGHRARRQAEALAGALAASGAVVHHAADALVAVAPDGHTVTLWNPAAERLFGWSAEDVVGRPLPILPIESADGSRHQVLEHVRRGVPVSVVATRLRRDGTTVDVSLHYSAMLDADGEFAGWMAVIAEATENRALVDALVDGVAVLGVGGRVQEWNRAASELTGITANSAVGRPLPWPIGDREEPALVELGEGRWVEIAGAPLDAGGTEQVVVLRDVSRQKAIEDAHTLFLATTSHELKSPLTVITGFARLLLDRFERMSTDERRSALEAINRKATSLNHMAEQIMLGSAADAGHLDIELRPIDVGRCLHAATAGYAGLSPVHSVRTVVPDELPLVLGDAHSVEQVVCQLLENAFKYSPEGGTVTVTADARVDHVVVSVGDEGIGLSDEHAARVFDRFYRARRGSGQGGVGLGLYIVRRLVEAHNGRVWASGAPGLGTTFCFTLPLAPSGAVDDRPRSAAPAASYR